MQRKSIYTLVMLPCIYWYPSRAFGEITPKIIGGSGGIMSATTSSESYKPTKSAVPSMVLGLDISLTRRWSLGIRTISTQNDSIGGTRLGFSLDIGGQKTELGVPAYGEKLYTITQVPKWTYHATAGLGRWVLSRNLESSLPFVPDNLKSVPVKVPLYGFGMSLGVQRHMSEAWAVTAEYSFAYAASSGITLVTHSVTIGPWLWL